MTESLPELNEYSAGGVLVRMKTNQCLGDMIYKTELPVPCSMVDPMFGPG